MRKKVNLLIDAVNNQKIAAPQNHQVKLREQDYDIL